MESLSTPYILHLCAEYTYILRCIDYYIMSKIDDKAETIHDGYGTGTETGHAFDDSIETTAPGKGVWLIVCTVSMGGFLFGMSPTLH